MNANTASQIRLARWLTLASYFSLVLGIYLWHIVIHKTEHDLVSFVLVIQLGPLMFPLRGLLHARIYTHAWSIYLAIFYFVLGVWYSSTSETLGFGMFLIASSLLFFIGAVLFTRLSARAANASSSDESA